MKMSLFYKTEKNSDNQHPLPPIIARSKALLKSKVKTNLNFSIETSKTGKMNHFFMNNDLNLVSFCKRFPQLLRGLWFLQCIIPYFKQDFGLSSSDPKPFEPQRVHMRLKFFIEYIHPFSWLNYFMSDLA